MLVRMRHKVVHFEKGFWRTAEEKRVLPVKEIQLQKCGWQIFVPKCQQKLVCGFIALLAMHTN